jgi:hypothetical protein
MCHEELRNSFFHLILVGDEARKDKIEGNSAQEMCIKFGWSP